MKDTVAWYTRGISQQTWGECHLAARNAVRYSNSQNETVFNDMPVRRSLEDTIRDINKVKEK